MHDTSPLLEYFLQTKNTYFETSLVVHKLRPTQKHIIESTTIPVAKLAILFKTSWQDFFEAQIAPQLFLLMQLLVICSCSGNINKMILFV